jgi:hypothetical protein
LESKALEDATEREAVEVMAKEALVARSQADKEATAAAAARIRAEIAAAEHSRNRMVLSANIQQVEEESVEEIIMSEDYSPSFYKKNRM